jgi:hypothetical protein
MATAHAAAATANAQLSTTKEFTREEPSWEFDGGDWKFIGFLSI